MVVSDSQAYHLNLPATSANLGPGFDVAALALDFSLQIDAVAADQWSIQATGRNAEQCQRLNDNLVIEVYRGLLSKHGVAEQPLAITMRNEIPLGMGCGSSAAGRLAGLALANHFGGLQLSSEQILTEATALEGHPDNAAACWLGGLAIAAVKDNRVHVACVMPPPAWRAVIVLPSTPLSTTKARALLPGSYTLADCVANLQAASLMALAFERADGELLGVATQDRLHQPYRAEVCPLLPRLMPLAGTHGILSVTLSGAGPAVLLIVESDSACSKVIEVVRQIAEEQVEIFVSTLPERVDRSVKVVHP